MSRKSAGLLMFRRKAGQVEFLLVHPGGPFWKNKDAGAWTIPKGEVAEGEDELQAAKREFGEELGFEPQGNFRALQPIKQKGGKLVIAWAFERDCEPEKFRSNTFLMEWPPRSGKQVEFPEIDQARFFTSETAREKLNPAQISFLEEVLSNLASL